MTLDSAALLQIALEAVAAGDKDGTRVDVWEHPDYPQIIESVSVREDGETTWYLNEAFDYEEATAREGVCRECGQTVSVTDHADGSTT